MDSRIMDVLADRVLELGPKPEASGPYRNFKLTRDADGIAWLLFDRAGTSANTLSADVIEELDHGAGGAGKPAARPGWSSARRRNPASSPAPTSTNFAARPIRARSRPRSAGRMR